MTPGEREQGGAYEARGAHSADGTGGGGGPDAAGGAPGSGAAGGGPADAAASGPRRGQDADLTGRVLGGRYRVTGRIGRGGMGVVCRAVDEVLGREVAVKVLRAYTDASAPELADLRTRMQREARAAARIRHSGVVTVHDVIDEDGRPVIVMELVDGASLDDAIEQRGSLDPRETARIGAQVMDALDAAHRAGVLHRDVKPGNVLLEGWGHQPGPSGPGGGRVVLTDFGIASIEAPGDGATTNLTRSGELVGSLDYLPPERAQGQDPTPACDIWSLGMTLYAAVEGGGAPFRRTSVWSTLTAIVTEALPEPRRAGPLTPVLYALMAKNPADRPSAAQARGLLQAVAEGREPVLPPAPGAPHPATATDVRPIPPPSPGGPSPLGPGPQSGADAGAPPAGWLAGGPGGHGGGPEPQGGGQGQSPAVSPSGGPVPHPGAATQPSVPAPHPSAPAPASQQPAGFSYPAPGPAYDPPGVVAGPPVGATGAHPLPGGGSAGRDTERLPARGRRRGALAAAAALAVLAAGGGVTYALVGGGPGRTVADGGSRSAAPAGTPGGPGAPSADGGKGDGKGDGEERKANGGGAGKSGGADAGKDAGPSAPGGPSDGGTAKDPKSGDTGGSSDGQGDGGQSGTGGGSGSGGSHGTSGGSGGGATGGSGGGPTPAPSSCVSIGGGRTNCDVWRTANSYTASFQQVGHLNMGTNYFYCQANLGRRETYGKWTNVWWAKTDDDSGNAGVYVSVVYLKGGANDQPVPGLPTC
ncbi:serine/threonine-protein kinase [Streptomyces lydicus]|uniref:serine/threonine-protein kinase n=1 Tax=Streptomyces lydicus TaxID=47763 RepID=UPI00378F6E1D